ncbi:MAG: hypothetical protein JST93_10520 [Acidobacteria bacterium]|nr:hypothetical protein [Acidobacteriota bacterium]
MLILLALLATQGPAQFTGNAICGDCHRNIVKRYAATTMSREGVLCENCHGPANLHAQGAARLEIPTALDPAPRDAVCAQCHFTGAARILKPNRDLARFRAGDLLTSYASSFIYVAAPEIGGGKTEQFALSRCRQKSPDLWCGSCHDTHSGKTDRTLCQSCHTPQQCNRGKDCISCHMPQNDHRIARRKTPPRSPTWQIRPFTASDNAPRELGLAYYELWTKSRNAQQQGEALRLLANLPKKDAKVTSALNSLRKAGSNQP